MMTTSAHARRLFLVAASFVAGCGPQSNTYPAGDESMSTTSEDSDTAVSGSGTEAPCPFEGWIRCDGECVSPVSDDRHCGGCGQACEVVGSRGYCTEGICSPTLGPCVTPSGTTFASCEEACRADGRSCVDQGTVVGVLSCAGSQTAYADEHACEIASNLGQPFPATCSDPLQWDVEVGFNQLPAAGIRCCCTQKM